MRKTKIVLSFLLLASFILFSHSIFAQGCSDAGFCSAGNLKAGTSSDSLAISTLALKLSFGSGEQGVNVVQIAPDLNWQISRRSGFQFTVPFVLTNGNLGSSSGAGDIMFAYTYKVKPKGKVKLDVTAGGKLATGKTNNKDNIYYSLPMPYQAGLGTTDLILGASARIANFNMAVGMQKVLVHDNKNTFLYSERTTEKESKYFESNQLKRGDDVLLRAGYVVPMGEVSITPGLLAIYRLNEDEIKTIAGADSTLKGSDGITLNVTVAALFPLKKKLSLLIEAGAPAVVRDVRADGLTRSFVAAFSLRYNFN